MNAVEVINISKKYGSVKAIENISFNVEKGELFGLIGPDGSGKTTTFRIITSLLLPDSGQVIVENMDVVKQYRLVRKIIGYMPGKFSLYEDLSVQENLNFFASVFGVSIEENYDLIKGVFKQLEPFKDRPAGKLSGGMKQKLALSCALIHRPKLLVLDEPTTGVDAVSRKEFWDTLKELKQKGITILVSTSYMDEAAMCDNIALINKGNILKINSPENIIKDYKQKLYSIKTDKIRILVNDLREYPHTLRVYAFGDSVHYTDKRQNPDIQELTQWLRNKKHQQIDIQQISPTIEDCFIDLMKD